MTNAATTVRPAKRSSKAPTERKTNAQRYTEIGERLISIIQTSGSLTWQSPYLASAGLPRSLSTGKAYRGLNTLLLWAAQGEGGYASAWWGTYKQITELGGQVRKGQHATQIVWWARIPKDETAPDGSIVKRIIPVMKTFLVFNVEQADWADGLPSRCAETVAPEFTPSEAAEAIAERYLAEGPRLTHERQDLAFYRPSDDVINVPTTDHIVSSDAYYATLFHEMTHSTGHATRLARQGITELTPHSRGSVYSYEELIAEFGSAFLCASVGLDSTLDNSAAYLASWVTYLSDDPSVLPRAAQQAQRAVDLICGVSFDQEAL